MPWCNDRRSDRASIVMASAWGDQAVPGTGSGHAVVEGERGATVVEYSILLAAIAAMIIAVAFTIGGQVLGLFESLQIGLEEVEGA